MEVRYLINLASMMQFEPHLAGVPECFFRRPCDLITDALEAGYDGVQVIPLRGMDGEEQNIAFFEEAWNPVWSFPQALRHLPGRSGAPSQREDWVVSPNPTECSRIEDRLRLRGIREIHHGFSTPGAKLVEVSPALSMTASQIARNCDGFGIRLVMDTWHLRRGYRSDEIYLGPIRANRPSPLGETEEDWFRTIDTLVPHVAMVHVNPGKDTGETEKFLTYPPAASITGRLLRHLLARVKVCCMDEIILVAEPRPILRGDGGIKQAREMLAVMKSMVG